MLTEYIQAALRQAKYEILAEGEDQFYGEIPPLQGVWATGATLEECREELREVIEDWILVSLSRNLPLPPVAGIDLNIRHAV